MAAHLVAPFLVSGWTATHRADPHTSSRMLVSRGFNSFREPLDCYSVAEFRGSPRSRNRWNIFCALRLERAGSEVLPLAVAAERAVWGRSFGNGADSGNRRWITPGGAGRHRLYAARGIGISEAQPGCFHCLVYGPGRLCHTSGVSRSRNTLKPRSGTYHTVHHGGKGCEVGGARLGRIRQTAGFTCRPWRYGPCF